MYTGVIMFDGKRLKSIRNDKNITQKELGKILSLSHATINRYERGVNEPDSSTIVKIAEYFDVTLDYLLGRVDEPNAFLTKETANSDKTSILDPEYLKVLKEAKEAGFLLMKFRI
jgi:transcriptional regulator with XRE-family HTH domain